MAYGPGRYGQMPADLPSAYAILDISTGSRTATLQMLSGTRWAGAPPTTKLSSPVAGAIRPLASPMRVAGPASATMTAVPTVIKTFPSIGNLAVELLEGGELRIGGIGGGLFTVASVLHEIDLWRGRAAVFSVMTRFGLDQNNVVDLLAARAYVWIRSFGPTNYWALHASGPDMDRASESGAWTPRYTGGGVARQLRRNRRN
jgi:hypothetical protein